MKPVTEFTTLVLSVFGTIALVVFLAFVNTAHTCSELMCAVSSVVANAKF
jgi:hypothetical protein